MLLLTRPRAAMRRFRARLSNGDWLPVIRRLAAYDREVGLSFDDGPSPRTTPDILELLRARRATATFFVTGERARAEPRLIAQIIGDGHDVFSHGWRHIHYDRVREAALLADLERAEAAIALFRPTPSPYLVRLPYGSGHATAAVHRTLRRWHPASQIAHWGHSIEDWRLAEGCLEVEQLEAVCRAAADTATARADMRGSILLIHEDPYGVSAPLKARVGPLLLDEILRRLDALGLRAVKLQPVSAQSPLRRYVRA